MIIKIESRPTGTYPIYLPKVDALNSRILALATAVTGRGQAKPCSYREQIFRTARSLRRLLLDACSRFERFRHP